MRNGSTLSFIVSIVTVAALAAILIMFAFYAIANPIEPVAHAPLDDNDACYIDRIPIGIMSNGSVGVRIGDGCVGISLEDGSVGLMP